YQWFIKDLGSFRKNYVAAAVRRMAGRSSETARRDGWEGYDSALSPISGCSFNWNFTRPGPAAVAADARPDAWISNGFPDFYDHGVARLQHRRQKYPGKCCFY